MSWFETQQIGLALAGAASRSPGPSQSAAGTSSRDLRSNTASKTRSLVIRGGSSAPQASGASTHSRRAPGRARKPAVKAVEAAGAGAASQPQLPPAAASAVAAASPDTPQLAGEGCGTDQLVFDRRKLEQQMVSVYSMSINRSYVHAAAAVALPLRLQQTFCKSRLARC